MTQPKKIPPARKPDGGKNFGICNAPVGRREFLGTFTGQGKDIREKRLFGLPPLLLLLDLQFLLLLHLLLYLLLFL